MTITVTDVVAGPYTLTGGADVLGFDFKVFSPGEIEVYTILASSEVLVDPGDYQVQIDTDLAGNPVEGGTVTFTGTAGQVVQLRANPSFEQEQVFTLLGFRPPTLNEAMDRAALRSLYLLNQLSRAILAPTGSTVPSPQDIIDAATLISTRMSLTGDNASRPDFRSNFGLPVAASDYATAGSGDASSGLRTAADIAVAQGRILDGEGKLYGLDDLLTLPPGIRFRNFGFIDIDANGSGHDDRKLINIIGDPNDPLPFLAENIVINRNGDGLHGYINGAHGFYFENTAGGEIRNMEVFGDNEGCGITAWRSRDFIIDEAYVHDMRFITPYANDVQNLLWVQFCEGFKIRSPRLKRCGYGVAGQNRYGNCRGLVIGGSSFGTVTDNHGERLGQWTDLTGSDANYDIQLIGGVGRYFRNNGVTFKNSTSKTVCVGYTVEQASSLGFGYSEPGAPQQAPGRDGSFIGCRAINCGTDGISLGGDYDGAVGFAFFTTAGYDEYPKGPSAESCYALCDTGFSTFTVYDTDELQVTDTRLAVPPGVRLRFSTTGTLPAGLSLATDYWSAGIDSQGRLKVASTYGNAIDTIAKTGFSGGTGTHTVTIMSGMSYGAARFGDTDVDGYARIALPGFRSRGHLLAETKNIGIPRADVYRNTTQTLASAVSPSTGWASVAPSNANYDALNLSGQNTAQPEFTAKEAGIYRFRMVANFAAEPAAATTGARQLKFQKSAAGGSFTDVPGAIAQVRPVPTIETICALEFTLPMEENDRLIGQGWQNSGVSLDLTYVQFVFELVGETTGKA